MFVRMIFRCGRCRRICSLNAHWKDRTAASIACSHCAATFILPYDPLREPDEPFYLDEIRRLAAEHKVDPATACSIREGILTPEQARLPHTPPSFKYRNTRRGSGKEFVIGGALLLLALVVTIVPFRQASALPPAEVVIHEPPLKLPPTVPFEVEAPPLRSKDPIVFNTDPAGQLTQVWGPNPHSVLLALCEPPEKRTRIVAAYLAPALPPAPRVRMGVVRDLFDYGALQGVLIRKDGRTGRWYAGNGREPIALERLEATPAGAEPV